MNALLIARRDLGALLHGYLGWFIVALVLFLVGVAFQIFALGSGAHYSHEVLETFFEVAGIGFNVAAHMPVKTTVDEDDTGPVSVSQVVKSGGGHG